MVSKDKLLPRRSSFSSESAHKSGKSPEDMDFSLSSSAL
jgi:hypothetical protein